MRISKNQKIIIIGVGLVTALIVLIIARPWKKDDPTYRSKDDDLNLIHSLSDEEWRTKRPDIPEVNITQVERKNFIKDIVFEKDPACAGEDFEVQVLAENPDGPESELTYRIGGKAGNPAILRFKKPGEKAVNVFVRDTRGNIDHRRYKITVVTCPERPIVHLKADYSNTRAEEAEFEVVKQSGLECPCTYQWDFGDNTSETTSRGFVTHNYGKREQTEFASTFLASVTVIDSTGESAIGRTSISFPNIHWISTRMGYSVVPIIYDRFPFKSGNTYEVDIAIKNIYDQDITFNNAEISYRPCERDTEKLVENYAASSLFSRTTITGGEIVEDTITFTKNSLPKLTCGMLIKLKGTFADGKSVTGRINLTIPMTKEEALKTKRGTVVTDEELIEKIRRAREILGKDYITPADIRKLEKEGEL